jgi:hypothetical protein
VYIGNDLQDEHIGNIYFKGILSKEAENAIYGITPSNGASAYPSQSPKQEWGGHVG